VPRLEDLVLADAPAVRAHVDATPPAVAELPRETRQQRRARERDEHKRARKKGG
jgi:hypothetical protein